MLGFLMAVLAFCFNIIIFALGASFVITVVIFVPLTIYVIPYLLWIGNEHTKGKHQDKKKEGAFKTAKHATILYKSWISRKEPTF